MSSSWLLLILIAQGVQESAKARASLSTRPLYFLPLHNKGCFRIPFRPLYLSYGATHEGQSRHAEKTDFRILDSFPRICKGENTALHQIGHGAPYATTRLFLSNASHVDTCCNWNVERLPRNTHSSRLTIIQYVSFYPQNLFHLHHLLSYNSISGTVHLMESGATGRMALVASRLTLCPSGVGESECNLENTTGLTHRLVYGYRFGHTRRLLPIYSTPESIISRQILDSLLYSNNTSNAPISSSHTECEHCFPKIITVKLPTDA
ncbi:uncharacterized protein BDR25DRAFT_358149 [Lindgomyces ingoldianus]|uniref:Uncharacterized protein n=1 Tax=Lindgomyces ingoldianus TaxID=673940 RepID=A0ACB6QLJ6_9PLEO|nr:uncharacterized protein BDR25DRAFT_358149 [Lindgomyces ingoldianus]KAF2467884.1 hypothetical protein BDR25DRAFT_358149 [Lindgomyces ingoldianus]